MMMGEILTPMGVRRQIEREGFGTQPTIRRALRGDYDAANRKVRRKAERIRQRALALGGVEAAEKKSH